MEDFIIIKGFLKPDVISYILKMAEKKIEAGSKVGTTVQPKKKRRKDVFFSQKESSIIDKDVFNKIKKISSERYNIDLKYRETYKLGSYYGDDLGFYNPHTDTQGGMGHRKISVVICLSNDSDYENGVFKLIDLKKEVKFGLGDAIIFKSHLLHGVEPVTAGKRQVLISFMWDEDGAIKQKKRNKLVNTNRYLVGNNKNTKQLSNQLAPINKVNVNLLGMKKNKIFNYDTFDQYDPKIISYSLWGDSEIYNYGVVENALVAKKELPDFKIYVYHNKTILPKIFNILERLDNVKLILVNNNNKSARNMFWRFKPCFYSSSIVFIRDADSLMNKRDFFVIKDFIDSPHDICSCKDARPHFKYAFVGGAWGCKNGILNKEKYKLNLSRFPQQQKDVRGIDQDFLIQIFYDNLQNIQLYIDKNQNKSNIIEKNIKTISVPGKHICHFNYFTPQTRALLNERNNSLNTKRFYQFGNSNESFRNAFNLITIIPPDSGPGNQIIAIKESLILSKLLNRICLIPPIRDHYIKSNTSFYNFNDIFDINFTNILIDDDKSSILNNLNFFTKYNMYSNYFKKHLRHENLLTDDKSEEVLLKKTKIKSKKDLSELKRINDNVLVIKHIFNNVDISDCGTNGCFDCKLNPNFEDIYKNICSHWDFSKTIKNLGNSYIKNNFNEDSFIAIHIRMPDYTGNKKINQITDNVFDDDKIIKIVDFIKNKHNKPVYIASNNVNYFKDLNLDVFYYDLKETHISFIEQYICSASDTFYFLNLDDTRFKRKHNRSTWTSFVIDYRNYFSKKENNVNLRNFELNNDKI
tara:strand:+ start:2786 stop:5206 length:2421 start_codon:yes stop_codon:yes gene_type:complete